MKVIIEIKAVKHACGWGWKYAGYEGPPFGCYKTKAQALAAGHAKINHSN